MRRLLVPGLVVVALGACVPDLDGLSGGSPREAGVADAASDVTVDAADGAVVKRCLTAAPFTSVKLLSVDTSGDEFAATLSPDELEIWFGRDGKILHATRPTRSDAFGAATALALSATGSNGDPSVSADLLSLAYIHVPTSGPWDIYMATRSSTATDFGTPKLLTAISVSGANEVLPFLTANGQHLYFESDVAGDMDVYVASASGPDFTAPTKVVELSSLSTEIGAIVTDDDLTAYVASNRPDGGAKGKLDVLRATRSSASAPFGALTNVPELNSAEDERVTWISRDRCRVYFDSSRSGGPGAGDLYVAERFPN